MLVMVMRGERERDANYLRMHMINERMMGCFFGNS